MHQVIDDMLAEPGEEFTRTIDGTPSSPVQINEGLSDEATFGSRSDDSEKVDRMSIPAQGKIAVEMIVRKAGSRSGNRVGGSDLKLGIGILGHGKEIVALQM